MTQFKSKSNKEQEHKNLKNDSKKTSNQDKDTKTNEEGANNEAPTTVEKDISTT